MVNILGHRGAMAYEPENTLRSIRRALDMGVDAVEVDIQLSKDGRLVVIHDATVDRTTGGRGRVKDLTFSELRRLDAGEGERIPSLDEALEMVKGRAQLIVELKQPDAAAPALTFFRQQRAFEHATLISFWHPVVKALKEQEPRLRTGVLMVGCPADPGSLGRAALADLLVLQYRYVNGKLVAAAHQHGLQVYVWAIDDIEILKPYLKMNLDGIASNRPDVLIKYLRGGPGN